MGGESATGRRGWPGKRALVAALALHFTLCLLLIEWWRPAPEPEQHAVAVALVTTERLPAKEALAMPALPQPHRSSATLPTPEPTPPAPASEQPPSPPPEPAGDDKTAAFTAPPAPSPPPRLDDLKPPGPPAVKPTAPSSSKKPRVPVGLPKPVAREGVTPSDPMPGIAVYDVVVDARGQIRSVTLAHSSGTTSIDARGEAMIRDGFGVEPATDAGHVVTVTIAFTPEGR